MQSQASGEWGRPLLVCLCGLLDDAPDLLSHALQFLLQLLAHAVEALPVHSQIVDLITQLYTSRINAFYISQDNLSYKPNYPNVVPIMTY